MVSKRLFIGDPGEALVLHIYCSGLWETEIKAILSGDKVSSQYSSFGGKMVLKRPNISENWGSLCSFVQVSWKNELYDSIELYVEDGLFITLV